MNLPKTGFPMRAGLSKSEPKRLKDWQDNKVYEQVLKKNEGHKKFVLHDGPPYANGPIHIGHAMNKISKDMINRYWMMQGYEVPYVPGWDCHGQPIEHKVEEKLGTEKFNQTSTAKIRELCNKFAVENIELQKAGFRRLGVLGDWDNPYLTLYHQHDAADIEVFKAMFDKGMIYFTGGNSFFLIDQLRKTGTNELLKKELAKGKLMIGESAGAIVCAPSIQYIEQMDEKPEDYSQEDDAGLNLIDFYVLPHFLTAPFKKVTEKIMTEFSDLNLCPINNRQGIVIDGEGSKVICKD
jgi:hypothetical protein